jgi:hypothetical protein
MIYLTNIYVDGDFVFAHARDMQTGVEVDLKVHKSENIFTISNGETYGDFVKACGVLQGLGKKTKLPKEYEINWGM